MFVVACECKHAHVHVCAHVCVCMLVCKYVYVCVSVSVWVYKCVCMHVCVCVGGGVGEGGHRDTDRSFVSALSAVQLWPQAFAFHTASGAGRPHRRDTHSSAKSGLPLVIGAN